jgi:hypothetical protein
MLEAYNNMLSLSSLCEVPEVPEFVGITFLKKILEVTNTRAEPKAERRPTAFDAVMAEEHASITPTVRGRRDKYVCAE